MVSANLTDVTAFADTLLGLDLVCVDACAATGLFSRFDLVALAVSPCLASDEYSRLRPFDVEELAGGEVESEFIIPFDDGGEAVPPLLQERA